RRVRRRAAADPEAATRADGVAVDATVLADPPAARIEEIPGALAERPVAREDRLATGPGEEAQVLGIGLGGNRQPRAARELAHGGLVQLAEREAHPAKRRRSERGEHVALVLVRIRGHPQQTVTGPRVVTGREAVGAEALGELEHRVQAHAAVAAHTWVWRQTGGVRREPR